MAEGTRLKNLDESLKSVQESQIQLQKQLNTSQSQMQSEVDAIASSLEDTKKLLHKVLAQFSSGPSFTKPPDSGSPTSMFGDGPSVLGRHKPAHITLPSFSGSNPERWVSQATRYFDFYAIPVADRLTIASFHLDDAAADWYDWKYRISPFRGWTEFSDGLIQRFKTKNLESPEGLLAKLTQSSTVADYRHQFEEISNREMVLPPPFLIQCFISGLLGDIKQSVLIHRPTTLEDAMTLAQAHENRIQLERGLGRVTLGSSKPILNAPKPLNSIPPSSSSVSLTPNPKSTPPSVGFRRLTPTELALKRSQGLCFRCDEKYTWDHKCKSPPQLLFFDDDPPDSRPHDSPSHTVSDAEIADQIQVDEVKTHSTISYNALAGGCSASTLRFTGTVKGKPVQVLLDGGSTHCFVQTRMANFLNLTIEQITPFSVLVGSGEKLPCSGIARQVKLTIQDHSILIDFYVLPLQGWDMVLGVSWLSTLGPIITDYASASFEFQYNGKQVVWKGDSPLQAQPIQFNGLRRLAHTDSIDSFFHVSLAVPPVSFTPDYPPDIVQIISEFASVFQPPSKLPPARSQDHAISLILNSSPVSVRPYRYPHFQKNEIERLVAEML
ncbi:uncharacterized protein LOC110913370 [Helianthus annuus]|uniref:uncharacterized protein LOC110913370 n=1 Tax=Helianthus annuus TaxID=4232 RepID=UPI000B8F0E42|nr:uncharacterized protein LOC110913370 [Helianthus annuus]